MIGLAAARLPAVAWPGYLGLDAHAAAVRPDPGVRRSDHD
jgi:hypothetical protein